MCSFNYSSSGLSIVPVARYLRACIIDWHRWEQPVVAVSEKVPISAYSANISLYSAHTGILEEQLLYW